MSEPNSQVQVSFDNPNITSYVPGKQNLRDGAFKDNFTEVPGDHRREDTTGIKDDTNETDDVICKINDNTEKEDKNQEDFVMETSKEDVVLTPVLTVTKEEAVLTKGDLKMQKVTVTEDISGTRTATTVGQENVAITNNGETIRDEVFRVQHFRTGRKTVEKEQPETRKPKTRIPTLRFRQAVDKLKQERTSFEEKKEPETPQPTPRRSSIPRLKDARHPTPNIKDSTLVKDEKTESLPRLSDEFDKLYDEIAGDEDSLDNLSMTSRIEDPVKLDNTFEEIIHAYEENKIQSINVEKVKHSKIPLLKRKSETEIEVPKQMDPVFRKSVSVDVTKTTNSGSITPPQDLSKIYSVTLNKSPIRTSLISKRVSETNAIRESTGSYESITAVKVATVEEINNNTESNVINTKTWKEVQNKTQMISDNEANITTKEKVETVQVVPIIEHITITNESLKSEIKDNANKAVIYETKSVEELKAKNIHSEKEETQYALEINTKTENIDEVQNETLKYVNTTKNIDKIKHEDIEKSKYVEKSLETIELENKNEEDIPILRGKVNRIIKRMDSKETEVISLPIKKELADEIPKKRSVLSKIAMFEHSEPADVTPKAKIHSAAETSKTKPMEHTPVIVQEVLKAMPARVIGENNDKNIDNYINKSNASDNNNYDAAINFDPYNNEHSLQIEIVNEQPLIAIQSVEPVQNQAFNNVVNVHQIIDLHPVFNPEDGGIPIVGVQPKSPVVSTKAVEVEVFVADKNVKQNNASPVNVIPFDAPNFVDNNQNPTDLQHIDFSPALVESKVSSPMEIQNNRESTFNKRNPFINSNESKHVTPETELRQIFHKPQHIFKNTPSITPYFDDSNEREPISPTNRLEIVSNVTKQEVKYERINVDDKTEKIKENGIFHKQTRKDEGQLRIHSYRNNELDNKIIKSKSLAELDFGEAVRGRVRNMVVRMNSSDRLDGGKKEIIDIKERPRKRSVSEKIALFERKLTPIKLEKHEPPKIEPKEVPVKCGPSEEEYAKMIEELTLAKSKYGVLDADRMKYLELKDGGRMPAIGLGTALLDPKLTRYIVQAAIDLGYRTIDTAYIYGNEKEVGEAINNKIKDGTVKRSELFIISKLWSTYHRQDLVRSACRASLDAMGLEYFDLYLIHNPMSFKEGGGAIPKIASVIQYSEHDYLDAWFGVEGLVRGGLARRGGVSNFNSQQLDRVVEKGKIKPVVNQVECHPYLSQHRLDEFCQARDVRLSCFGVLGSKDTPQEHKSALPPAIDDPLVRVMAAGLEVSPAVLLISYQLTLGRGVVVKASHAAHLWDNLRAVAFTPSAGDVSALHALNRNKRTFTFKGMGDTHRNYPFNIPF